MRHGLAGDARAVQDLASSFDLDRLLGRRHLALARQNLFREHPNRGIDQHQQPHVRRRTYLRSSAAMHHTHASAFDGPTVAGLSILLVCLALAGWVSIPPTGVAIAVAVRVAIPTGVAIAVAVRVAIPFVPVPIC